MSADSRTPHTDALDTLGSVITENEKRDAIHLAVEPAIAGCCLRPGDDVGFLGDGTLGLCSDSDCVGIVDPFLKYAVQKGERFWLIVYPRQITSLRHVWTHPKFPEEKETTKDAMQAESNSIAASVQWIKHFAESINQTYGSLMKSASLWARNNQYTYDNTRSYKEFWDKFPQFWVHYGVVTGEDLTEIECTNFFTCSC